MALSDVRPLAEGAPFGVRIGGITLEMTQDPAVRAEINALFHREGAIIFEDVEPSDEMQLALSDIFGPLKEHPVKSVARVDANAMPGVVQIRHPAGSGGVVEIGGQQLSHWLPWHFDHAYNDELNYAGILRATEIVEHGGLTGFADGIALYNAFPKDLLARIEDKTVIYTLNVQF
jgi:taurine dioxygenase